MLNPIAWNNFQTRINALYTELRTGPRRQKTINGWIDNAKAKDPECKFQSMLEESIGQFLTPMKG